MKNTLPHVFGCLLMRALMLIMRIEMAIRTLDGYNGLLDCVKLMLNEGASVNHSCRVYRYTALHAAANKATQGPPNAT